MELLPASDEVSHGNDEVPTSRTGHSWTICLHITLKILYLCINHDHCGHCGHHDLHKSVSISPSRSSTFVTIMIIVVIVVIMIFMIFMIFRFPLREQVCLHITLKILYLCILVATMIW